MPDQDQDDAAGRRKHGGRMSRIAAWRLEGRVSERRLRLVLLALSAGGVLLCLLLWSAGHGILALLLLAGIVVLATGILLAV